MVYGWKLWLYDLLDYWVKQNILSVPANGSCYSVRLILSRFSSVIRFVLTAGS